MSYKNIFLFLMLLAVMLVPFASNTNAQIILPTDGNAIDNISTISGTVKVVNGNLIELTGGGPLIDISGIQFAEGQNALVGFPVSSITPGTAISKAVVTIQSGQNIVKAVNIFIEVPDVTTFTGHIQSIDRENKTIMLLNQKIIFNDSTLFITAGNKLPPSFDRFKVGKLIKVTTKVVGTDVVALGVTIDKRLIRPANDDE